MYKIVAGSSCDMTEDMQKELGVSLVAFKITIDGEEYLDDENLDVLQMIDRMNKSKEQTRTACPAPGDFLKSYEGEDDIFVVTISKHLSGAYNAAKIAKDMYKEKNPEKKIHIFDSESASAGETAVVLKLREEIEAGHDFNTIVSNVNIYISELKTFFILESLNNLIKNGRISKAAGLIANVLNFKPIMQDNGKGEISLYEKVRGNKRAFRTLVDAIGKEGMKSDGRRMVITHVNAYERASKLRDEIIKRYNFKEIILVQTKGLCSVYADDGGIVVVY